MNIIAIFVGTPGDPGAKVYEVTCISGHASTNVYNVFFANAIGVPPIPVIHQAIVPRLFPIAFGSSDAIQICNKHIA